MQVMSSHYDNRAKGGATYQSSQQYHGGYEAGADKQRRSKPSSQRRDASPTTQGNFGFAGVANNVTPPSPTPDVGSSTAAQSQLDATQRRPAYLLHRDLVIGKGSYGQVCIASRGEAEGMTSSKAGKRKKFACKCVLLRSDPKYIAKLQEEVNVLRELRGHDNVIRLYDVFCVDNELFIITELGRGGDLFHLLTTHPKHGVTEAYAGKLFYCLSFSSVLYLANMLTLVIFHHLNTSYYSQDRFRDALCRGLSPHSSHMPS